MLKGKAAKIAPAGFLTALILLVLLLLSGCGLFAQTARTPPADSLVVSFIDVGQGDAILVQSAGESYLVDAGRSEEGPKVIDFLRSRGVESLNGIVVSNPDADHIGGFPDVFDAFEVSTIYLSGDTKGTSTFNAFLRAVRDEGSKVEEVRAGKRMDWGSARADVISPPPDKLFSETNDNSVGILLTFGASLVLLAGDAEKKAEEYMNNGPYAGPLSVLKVSHHGSNTSSTPLFLSHFPPEIAVIQVGKDNRYGHPTPQTLQRLQKTGTRGIPQRRAKGRDRNHQRR